MAAAAPDFFSDALRREIIRSEQQRMRALAVILAAILMVTLIVANFFPDYSARMFQHRRAGLDTAGGRRTVPGL